jgi:predicted lipoprotein with Yx(FWY)xxD motif
MGEMGQRASGRRGRARRVRRWSSAGLILGAGAGLAGAGLAGAGLAGIGSVGPAVAGATSSSTVIVVDHNKTWGSILALSNGDAVYRLTADPADKSVCSGACATAWPPVLLAAGQKSPTGQGVSGLGTITRTGGQKQVTYKGIPLYRYVGDHSAGQVNGNIKDTWGQWWTVNPAHPHATPTAAKSSGGGTATTSAGSGVAY